MFNRDKKNKDKTYLVYVLQGYDTWNKETQQMTNVIEFQIIAKDYEEAEKKAKLMYTKNGYRLATVIEKYEC